MPIPLFQTDRLLLRPFISSDAAAVQALAGAPEVAATTLNIPHPYLKGAAEAWINGLAERADAGQSFAWAIMNRNDEEVMGAISIGLHSRHQRGEIGYWLGVPFWDRGYMTEAAKVIVRHALGALGLHRVEAMILPRNSASIRVAEKSGLLYEGTLRDYVLKEGVFEDVAIYGRVRD